jgi:hypothetical protein
LARFGRDFTFALNEERRPWVINPRFRRIIPPFLHKERQAAPSVRDARIAHQLQTTIGVRPC